jgi:enoyl-[acyl-carrier-protein] reductase (NADH)
MAKELGVSPEEMMEKLTAGTDTGHLTKEEDVAELVMFLASSASQNITGEIINVSGGL